VDIVRGVTVVEITADEVVYEVAADRHRARVDAVVMADAVHATAPLADELDALGFEVHVIGDASHVGYIEGAIHTAWQVARSI
jgi:hypothetical protein